MGRDGNQRTRKSNHTYIKTGSCLKWIKFDFFEFFAMNSFVISPLDETAQVEPKRFGNSRKMG